VRQTIPAGQLRQGSGVLCANGVQTLTLVEHFLSDIDVQWFGGGPLKTDFA